MATILENIMPGQKSTSGFQFDDVPSANYGRPVEITKNLLEDLAQEPKMRGYELLKRYQKLTPYQQDQCIQYLLGGISMVADGFRDGHRDQVAARYALDQFETAIQYGAKQQPLQVDIPEDMLTPGFVESITGQSVQLTRPVPPIISLIDIPIVETQQNSDSIVEYCETCLL